MVFISIFLGSLIVTFLLNRRAAFMPFIYDDASTILRNPRILSGRVWQTFKEQTWRRLTLASYAMDVKPYGEAKPEIMRDGNCAIHSGNVVLATAIAWTWHLDPWTCGGVLALLLVHPFFVDPVNYIAARPSLLATLFLLGAVLAVSTPYWILMVPCLLLAFWAKEDSLAAVPGVLLIGYLIGTLPSDVFWIGVGVGSVSLVAMNKQLRELVQLNGDTFQSTVGNTGSLPWRHHVRTSIAGIYHQIRWMVGGGLAIDIQVPTATTWADTRIIVAIWAIGAVAAAAITYGPWNVIGPLCMILLAPSTLYWFVPVGDIVREDRSYYAAFGVALLLGMAVPAPWWVLIIVLAMIVRLHHIKTWVSPASLWANAAAVSPGHARARLNLGVAIHQYTPGGDLDNAEMCYRKALELNPTSGEAMNNLAQCYRERNDPDKAMYWQKRTVAMCPRWHMGWFNMALLRLSLPDANGVNAAYDAATQAVKCDSNSAEAWWIVGVVSARLEDHEASIQGFREAMRLRPDVSDYRTALIQQLVTTGQFDEALALSAEALQKRS